nr:MAG TPA: hypothetical protein [Caudoviricetes sp.]DAW92059.1 MAG TPA: hypothetical protein [Bacteriophage sp.]
MFSPPSSIRYSGVISSSYPLEASSPLPAPQVWNPINLIDSSLSNKSASSTVETSSKSVSQ